MSLTNFKTLSRINSDNLCIGDKMKKFKNHEIDEELYSFFQELLDRGVNGGLLAYLLCRHAMEIGLSAKADPHKIIYNLLSGLIGPISDEIETKPACLSSKKDKAINDNNSKKMITH